MTEKVVKLSSLLIDTDAETKGEWVEIKEWYGIDPDRPFAAIPVPGLAFRVRSLADPSYKAARQKAAEQIEALKKEYPAGEVPDEIVGKVEGEILAEHILLGWRGFDEPYSKKTATALLPKPAALIMRNMITHCAMKVGRKSVEFTEVEAKNLEK